MPQALAVVELDEGVRINTTLVGLAEDEIRVGHAPASRCSTTVPDDGSTLLRFTAGRQDHHAIRGQAPATEQPATPAPAVTVVKVPVSDKDRHARAGQRKLHPVEQRGGGGRRP
jgi:hypothetical protein